MMRTFVMGDPQAPFAKVLEVLDRHGALAGDRLADDVTLVSIGDHFDYDFRDPITAGQEGLKLVRWLASHEPTQVRLVFGNHDAARVMELAALSDAEFAEARAHARASDSSASDSLDLPVDQPLDFGARFPDLPPSGVIGRDYASFTTEQRAVVMELLLAGRFHLALVGELAGRGEVLLTHAGVTTRELGLLGLLGVERPRVIAEALEAYLAAAVGRVRADWRRGIATPLSLAPLHVSGGKGLEGGGLLYHRPSNPATGSTFDADRPRRFDPRTLPNGLTQIAGHSGHAKCVHELGEWCTDAARARKHGGIRALLVDGERVIYDLGVGSDPFIGLGGWSGGDGAAELILIDGELRRLPATEIELLELQQIY
jgi:hypothetical protein